MVSETRKQEIMEEDTELEMWEYALGFSKTAVVKCAIDLGIAEAIENHGSPMTLTQLSSTLKCAPSLLQRIMRFLVYLQIFKDKAASQGDIAFEQTPISRRLMRHGENSMAALILLQSSPTTMASWQSLSAHVQSNRTSAFEMAHGKDVWNYTAADASHSKLFNDAMACTARSAVSAIIETYPEMFDGIEILVDVGGGDGTAISMLVKAFPWIKGINFDLPHVVNAAKKFHGVEHVGGDMFDRVPKASAIFIKSILHDWGDDDCNQILKKCREALPKDKGKMIVVESIIEEDEGDKFKSLKLMQDTLMMAATEKGKERTFKEWDYIFRQAGFSRSYMKPIHALESVIEVYP